MTAGVAQSRATRYCRRLAAALAAGVVFTSPALAEDASNDPLRACDRAAAHAEAEWHLPAGLLAAIGMVESGRSGLESALPVAWPWSINAGGRGFYLSSKPAAIEAVRGLRAAGRQTIDVGCFQVDLFYHPEAFVTLETAFDPDANGCAAARILTLCAFQRQFSGNTAIALYHSASPIRAAHSICGSDRAVWPWARTRSAAAENAYVVLLSPAALQVRVITADDAPAPQAASLPRVLGPQEATAVVQWIAAPQHELPVVFMPPSLVTSRRIRRH